MTCGSCLEGNFILRVFTCTVCNPAPQHSHLAYPTRVDQDIFQKWNFYIPRRGAKHRANGMTQILTGTYNEDIKLDHRFIGYFIFNWKKEKSKKENTEANQPTYLAFRWIFGFTWQIFPLLKNLHKYCQDETRTVKTMQKPELSPTTCLSHYALPGQPRRGTGPAPGAVPPSVCHWDRGLVLPTQSLPFSEPF